MIVSIWCGPLFIPGDEKQTTLADILHSQDSSWTYGSLSTPSVEFYVTAKKKGQQLHIPIGCEYLYSDHILYDIQESLLRSFRKYLSFHAGTEH